MSFDLDDPALRDASLLDLERARRPALYNLLVPLSLAVRAELELVRALRHEFFPGSDPGLEADLWTSPVLQAADVSAVVILPEVRAELHEELGKDRDLLERTWDIVKEHHKDLDAVILLEERTIYHTLRGDLDRAQVELGSVLNALQTGTDDPQLLRWTSRFLNRLHSDTRNTGAAIELADEIARQTGADPPPGIARPAADGMTITLGIRRIPEGVWITCPPEPGAIELEVPLTDPVKLFLAWPTAEGWEERAIDIPVQTSSEAGLSVPETAEFTPTPAGQLRIRTVDQRQGRVRFGGESPLLFVLQDDPAAPLPEAWQRELSDLGWRTEIAALSNEQRRSPKVLVVEKLSRNYPVKDLIARLEEVGFEVVHFDHPAGMDHSSRIREELADAIAALLPFDDQSFGEPWFHETAGLFLDRSSEEFVFVPIPVDEAALKRLEEHELRDEFVVQTNMTTTGPPEEQWEQIRSQLAKLKPERRGRLGTDEATATLWLSGFAHLSGESTHDQLGIVDPDLKHALDRGHPVLVARPDESGLGGRIAPPHDEFLSVMLQLTLHEDLQRPIREHLVTIEREVERKRIAEFLAARFEITDEERALLERSTVTINDQPGFLYERLAWTANRPDVTPAQHVEIAWQGQSFKGTLHRHSTYLAAYKISDPPPELAFLETSERDVAREDRWSSLVGPKIEKPFTVAGIVRDPEFTDVPGVDYALACRLPGGTGITGATEVFAPMVRDGALVGVLTSIVPGADFGGEGDLAYAISTEEANELLASANRLEFVEFKTFRPDGPWAPPDHSVADAQAQDPTGNRPPEEIGWGFAELEDTKYQVLYRHVRTAARDAGGSLYMAFPPNDATSALQQCFAALREGDTESAQSGRPPILPGNLQLSAKHAKPLEELAARLQSGQGPLLPGLRRRIAGHEPDDRDPENPDGHRGTVRWLALTPNGRLAITAGNSHPDQTVKIWDLRTGKLLHTLEEQAEGAGHSPLALAAKGDLALTAYGSAVRLWNVPTGEQIGEWPIKFSESPVIDVSFAGPDHLIACSDDHAVLVDTKSNEIEPLGTGGGQHLRVAASEDGSLLAVLRESAVTIWKHDRGRLDLPTELNEVGHFGENDHLPFQRPPLRFGPDHRLFFGSPQFIWNEKTGLGSNEAQQLANVADYDGLGTAVWATSPGSIQVVDPNGKPLTPELQCGGREISCATISADGSIVVAADFDHHLWVWWLGERGPAAVPREEPREMAGYEPGNDRELVEKILAYMKRRGFEMLSFERIRKQFNRDLTNDDLEALIVNNGSLFQRATLKGGKRGLRKR